MDDWRGHLVVHEAEEFELKDGTTYFQCQVEVHGDDGLSGLCMGVADQRATIICRTCGLRTFTVCANGCLMILFVAVANLDSCVTCYCEQRSPGHEVVAIMSLSAN